MLSSLSNSSQCTKCSNLKHKSRKLKFKPRLLLNRRSTLVSLWIPSQLSRTKLYRLAMLAQGSIWHRMVGHSHLSCKTVSNNFQPQVQTSFSDNRKKRVSGSKRRIHLKTVSHAWLMESWCLRQMTPGTESSNSLSPSRITITKHRGLNGLPQLRHPVPCNHLISQRRSLRTPTWTRMLPTYTTRNPHKYNRNPCNNPSNQWCKDRPNNRQCQSTSSTKVAPSARSRTIGNKRTIRTCKLLITTPHIIKHKTTSRECRKHSSRCSNSSGRSPLSNRLTRSYARFRTPGNRTTNFCSNSNCNKTPITLPPHSQKQVTPNHLQRNRNLRV